MSDSISREDAVNEIHKYFVEEIDKTPVAKDEDGDEVYTDMPTVNSLLACNKELSKRIKALPSTDAVEVVRCKDCYHAEDDITHMFCVYFHHKVYEDDYCSNAVERRKDGEV